MLTREQIERMAGRNLDKCVNEIVYKRTADKHREGMFLDGGMSKYIPNFSTNESAAMDVVGTMGDKGWMMYKLAHTLRDGKINGYECIFLHIETGASREIRAYSAPLAICRAALLSIQE